MTGDDEPVFEFDEASHLMRVHLKLGLEDLGFSVVEDGERVSIVRARPDARGESPATSFQAIIGRPGPFSAP